MMPTARSGPRYTRLTPSRSADLEAGRHPATRSSKASTADAAAAAAAASSSIASSSDINISIAADAAAATGSSDDDASLAPTPSEGASSDEALDPDPAVSAPTTAEPAAAAKPFPWGKTWIIYAVICTNGIALTAPTSFLPAMCRDRFGMAEVDVGNAVGALSGAFSLAQFASSFLIGHLSDRFGRKPLILVGIGVCFCLLMVFGLSPSVGYAIANRGVEGASNGNIPVAKAVLADLITDNEHRAVAYGAFGASFALARVISAATTGFVFDAMDSESPLRYFVPCVVFAPLLLVVWFAVLCCLPESNRGAVARAREREHEAARGDARLEEEARGLKAAASASGGGGGGGIHMVAPHATAGSAGLDAAATATAGAAAVLTIARRRSSASSLDSLSGDDDDGTFQADAAAGSTQTHKPTDTDTGAAPTLREGLRMLCADRLMRNMIVLYCVNSFCNGAVLVADILFLSLSVERLGMGQTPTSVGLALSVFGVVALVYQFTVYRPLLARLGTLRMYTYLGTFFLAAGCIMTPMSAWPLAATSCMNVSVAGDSSAALAGVATHPSSVAHLPDRHRGLTEGGWGGEGEGGGYGGVDGDGAGAGAAAAAMAAVQATLFDMAGPQHPALVAHFLPQAPASAAAAAAGRVLSGGNLNAGAAGAAGAGTGVNGTAAGIAEADPGRCDQHLLWLSWVILLLSLALQSCGFMTLLPLLTTFLINVAPPHIQGLAQGTAQSLAALLRSVGPFASGVVFSAASRVRMPFIVYAVLGGGYALCAVLACQLPASVQKPRADGAWRRLSR